MSAILRGDKMTKPKLRSLFIQDGFCWLCCENFVQGGILLAGEGRVDFGLCADHWNQIRDLPLGPIEGKNWGSTGREG